MWIFVIRVFIPAILSNHELAAFTMNIVLVSTYDLGHQPFGLAEPAAWLRARGDCVRMLDLAVENWDNDSFRTADLVAFHVPMHTATRLTARLIPRLIRLNHEVHIAAFGLYAPTNEAYLREQSSH